MLVQREDQRARLKVNWVRKPGFLSNIHVIGFVPGFENSDEFHNLKVFSRKNSTFRGYNDRKPFNGRLEDLLFLCFQDVINCRAEESARRLMSFILNSLQTQNWFSAFSLSPRESNFYFIKSTVYLPEFFPMEKN